MKVLCVYCGATIREMPDCDLPGDSSGICESCLRKETEKVAKQKVSTIMGVCVCKASSWAWKVDWVENRLTLTCAECGREAHFQLENPSRDMKLDSIAEARKGKMV